MALRMFTQILPVTVILLLPALGLFSGPAYGPLGLGAGLLMALYRWRSDPRTFYHTCQQDWSVGALAAAAILWAAASHLWSIETTATTKASLQLTLVLGGVTALILSRSTPDAAALSWLERWFPWAMLAGAAFMMLDHVMGYALSHMLGRGETAPTKYNRGVNYLMIIVWPVLLLIRPRMEKTILAVALGLILAANSSTTVYLQLAGAVCVFALAWLLEHRVMLNQTHDAPAGIDALRLEQAAKQTEDLHPARHIRTLERERAGVTAWLLAGASLAFGAAFPFIINAISVTHRMEWRSVLKHSASHRLEIWDYLSEYVAAHPWIGSGFGTAKSLRPTAEQLATYQWADQYGIYPHNQWLEVWVGLGAIGFAIAACAVWMMARGINRLPQSARPYACASFASAQILCLTSFEVTTDSWWGALGLTILLFAWISKAQLRSDP